MSAKLKIKPENASNCNIDDYIQDIRLVWKKHDPGRHLYDMWLHTVNHASKLGEEVRRGRFDKVLIELADVIMWFLTFVGRLQESVSKRNTTSFPNEQLFHIDKKLAEVVWNKYPNLCPVCFFRLHQEGDENQWWGKKCECLLNLRQVETRNEILEAGDADKQKNVKALGKYATDNQSRMIVTVEGLQDMFGQIFEANINNSSLESIAFHLLEEIGEVSDALIRAYTYKGTSKPSRELYSERMTNLENELADIISWIFAVSLKVKQLYAIYEELPKGNYRQPMTPVYTGIAKTINFWDILWRRYGQPDGVSLWCPHCRNQYCSCSLTFVSGLSEIET